MKIFNLLETQYNKFSQSVHAYLSKTLSDMGSSYGNNTIFGQILNVLGNVVQNIMLYIEDSLVEQNKFTAQRKKSIYGLASISGYQPSYGKTTGVQLKLSYIPTNESNLDIIINNKESLTCTQNGLQYNMILPQEAIVMSIEKDNSDKFIYAVQGKFETQTFMSVGGEYYTQNFKFLGNMDTDYMVVKINNEKWELKDSIYDMMPEGKQYTYKVSINGGIDLIFGNGQFGQPLNDGDMIEVTYLIHDGESGNLDPNLETYFVFNNNLTNIGGEEIDGNSVFNISFATNDPVTSGSNSESIIQVKNMIGYNSRSLVLSSPEHYKNMISKFSFCGYNRTWSDPGSLIINSLIMRNYKQLLSNDLDYFNLKKTDFILTKNQKDSIISCIKNSGNQLAGTTYIIHDPDLYQYALYIYVKLKSDKSDKVYVRNQIRTLLGEFFSNINSDIFIPKSDIIHLLKSNIDSIDGIDMYFLSEKNETALIKRQYNKYTYKYNNDLGTYDKYNEVVYLYPGENPNLGLDSHGNIYLNGDNQFPVLMGGWQFKNSNDQLVTIVDPVTITFE